MEKSESIKSDLIRCRKLIENQLGWGDGQTLTRREHELLSEKVFDKTGVLLSMSTLRRIWNDDFKNIPHKSTLDALAVYVGYSNWQHFTESQVKLDIRVGKKANPVKIIIIGAFVVLIAVVIIMYIQSKPQSIEIAGPVVFNYHQKNKDDVPNIIVFDYDVSNVIADSYYIVESSRNYLKKKLNVKKGQMTSSYFIPGNYEAFLVADDSIVSKLNIEILSNSWVAMINYLDKPENVPFYIYEDEIINDGKIGVVQEMLSEKQIPVNNRLNMTLSNTFNSGYDSDSGFVYTTRIKLEKAEISLSSPKIYLGILFAKGYGFVPLVNNGGQHNLQLVFGDAYLSSNDSDLSGFGCDIYNWQDVKIISERSEISIFINDVPVTQFTYLSKLGELKGYSFTFDGIGSVDYVSTESLKNETIYFNDF